MGISNLYDPINLGNQGEFTIDELATEVARLCGANTNIKHEPLPADDPRLVKTVEVVRHELAFEGWVKRYKGEKAEIKTAAEKLEAQATEFDKKSDEQIHQHHRWAQATTALQIAIAMAAIALLTKRKWSEYLVYALSAVGVAAGVLAWFHV